MRRPTLRLPTLWWLAVGLAALVVAAVPASAQGSAGDPLDQTVAADEETVLGPETIAEGHVDLGPRFVDGTWRLQARDDRTVPPVWRFPEDTVFHVLDEAILSAPDNPDYAFLGAAPGDPLYVIPQVQLPGVVWLGWNTQDPEVTTRIDRGATLVLHGVEGPGEMFLFLQEGVSGAPNVLWDSTRDSPQDLWMEVNTHTHANWVFTAPGVYLFDVEVRADLVDADPVAARSVLRFAVGTTTDPQDALVAELSSPASTESPGSAVPDGTSGSGDGDGPGAGGDQGETEVDAAAGGSNLAALLAGAVLLAVIAATVSVVVSRRRRAAAETEPEADR